MKIQITERGSLDLLALGHFGWDLWNAFKQNQALPKDEIKRMTGKKVLLIGWDAADWTVIDRLVAKGEMPAMKKFLEGGASGKISTMEPSFSPMLWTSIATGKYADKHGVLGFVEVSENGTSIQPVSSSSRKCNALWNILGSKGLKSNVVGWWPSHPVEKINGVMISNQFHKVKFNAQGEKAWMNKNTVSPESIKSEVEKYRIHTSDLTEAHLLPFVPDAIKVDQEKDQRLSHLGDAIAQLATVQATTTYLMQNTDWDLTAVYLNDMDMVCHKFGSYTAPKADHISQEDFDLYKDVVDGIYKLYDKMLDRMITLAGEDTNIIILSDHGFKLGAQKVQGLPKIPAAIALEHNPFGIIAMAGPDIKANATIYEAGLLDITPTILQIFNLPIAKDMDGKILLDPLKNHSIPAAIESYDALFGDYANKKSNTSLSDSKEAIQQLVDLGYIDAVDEDVQEQINKIDMDTQYNLSVVLRSQNKNEEALQILNALYEKDKVDIRFTSDLISLHLRMRNFEAANKVLSNFKKFDISKSLNFNQVQAKIYAAESRLEEAKELLLQAYSESPNSKGIAIDLAMVYNRLQEFDQAEKHLKRILAQSGATPKLLLGLVRALALQKKHEESIEYCMQLLEMKPRMGTAHYFLGFNLFHLENYEAAEMALETSLFLNPGINRSRNLLLNLYKGPRINEAKYLEHKKLFDATCKEEVIIVTGLPRSGTSMVMQMLHGGGFEIFSDSTREADESNPRGYLELEAVKGSMKDTSWMQNAGGKAVKVVTPLLPTLPLRKRIKLIWIERNISEVILSQEEMLLRSNPNRKMTLNLVLQEQFQKMNEKVEEIIQKKNNVEVLKLKHHEVIENPRKAAEKIREFLDDRGDVAKMAKAVDKSLHRVKVSNKQYEI